MKRPSPRVWSTAAIVALGVVVFCVIWPRRSSPAPSAAPVRPDSDASAGTRLATNGNDSGWTVRADTLHAGETLAGLLERAGVRGSDAGKILTAATQLDPRRTPAGMPVALRMAPGDSTPSEVVFQPAVDRLIHVRRLGDSAWTGTEERLPWRTDTIALHGVIASNLYAALDDSAATVLPKGARSELAWSLADIYEYRVDMSRELQPGDAFRVLFERSQGPGGVVRIGNILAARFELSGSETDAVRFTNASGRSEYFDQQGRSMRAAFLRAPLEFRRISSTFGRRLHPILGIWRNHTGTDYAANEGTPVRAIGDGTVIFAGRRGGYGNMIDIRHRNGIVSRYGHMRGFARGIRPGREVTIGQTIGYVGMTGLATGPHLHFEILIDGRQRDPRTALKRDSGLPIAAADVSRFDAMRDTLLAKLSGAVG